jgi:glucose/arabinose dehydrogenase
VHPYHARVRRTIPLAAAVLLIASGCTLIPLASPSPAGSPASPSVVATPGPSVAVTPTPTISPGTTPVPSPVPVVTPTPSRPVATARPSGTPSTQPGFKPGRVQLKLEQVADLGDVSPVYVTGDGTGEGLLYVVERAGRIRVMNEQGRIKGTLLDLRGRVGVDGERGMHSVAFHPDFGKNGKFYVHYNTPAGNTRIVEYQLGFGPDGYLYIALGDGGGNSPGDPFGNGQDKTDIFGNILRIDVDRGNPYAIPKGNPFAKGGGRKEIWSYGLRNPWRASFDSKTGNLWIGDVGQDRIEEVDIQPKGKGGLNFGWSTMEGSVCHKRPNCSTKGLTLPVTEYGHGVKGCSVVGGYVYRGTQQPLLDGAYLFTDYCGKSIYGLDSSKAKAGAKLAAKRLLTKSDSVFVSLGQGDDGELYVVSIGGGIYHIVAKPR